MLSSKIASVVACHLTIGGGTEANINAAGKYQYDPALRALQKMFGYELYGQNGADAFEPPPPETGGGGGGGGGGDGDPNGPPGRGRRPPPAHSTTPPPTTTSGAPPANVANGGGRNMLAEGAPAARTPSGSTAYDASQLPVGPHGVTNVAGTHGGAAKNFPGLVGSDPTQFLQAAKQALGYSSRDGGQTWTPPPASEGTQPWAADVPQWAKDIIARGGTAADVQASPGWQQNANLTGDQWQQQLAEADQKIRSSGNSPELNAQQASFAANQSSIEDAQRTALAQGMSPADPNFPGKAGGTNENAATANNAYGISTEATGANAQGIPGRMPVTPGPGRPPTTTVPPRPPNYVPPPTEYNIPPPTGETYGIPPQVDPSGAPVLDWGTNGASGNRNLAGAAAFASARDMYAHPYLDPSVQNAIAQQGMNATRAQFAGQQGQADRRRAVTGNSAGYAAGNAQAGREQAGAYGMQARQNTIDFEKEAQRRKEAAQSQMQNIYGQESQYNLGLLGGLGGAASKLTGSTSGTRQTSSNSPLIAI